MMEANSLTFIYNDRLIFQNISFKLEEGEILQVLGPNGSGKTTLLKILAGLLTPTQGTLNWKSEKSLIYIGHKIGIKNCLTVKENMLAHQLYGKLREGACVERILDQLKLKKNINHLCSQLSEGQRRRLALARLLLLDAKLWILDEPFIAIDKEGISLLLDLMTEHITQQGVVIFASHQIVGSSSFVSKRLKL